MTEQALGQAWRWGGPGFLLVDADNAFNSRSRVHALLTAWHLWSKGACFAFKCYHFHARFVVCNRDNPSQPSTLWSRKRVTKGDPLSMYLYGLSLVTLAQQVHVPCATQSWRFPWFQHSTFPKFSNQSGSGRTNRMQPLLPGFCSSDIPIPTV